MYSYILIILYLNTFAIKYFLTTFVGPTTLSLTSPFCYDVNCPTDRSGGIPPLYCVPGLSPPPQYFSYPLLVASVWDSTLSWTPEALTFLRSTPSRTFLTKTHSRGSVRTQSSPSRKPRFISSTQRKLELHLSVNSRNSFLTVLNVEIFLLRPTVHLLPSLQPFFLSSSDRPSVLLQFLLRFHRTWSRHRHPPLLHLSTRSLRHGTLSPTCRRTLSTPGPIRDSV